MDISDQISGGALIISFISFILSVGSFYLSKKAYRISNIQHQERYKSICGYLIDCYKWENNDCDFVSFAISYTNNASEPSSFKDIFLEIEYCDELGELNSAKLSPKVDLVPIGLAEEYVKLTLPINLNAKETKSGWISFKLPKIKETGLCIDCYRVIAISPREQVTAIETSLVRKRVIHEEH